MNESALAPLPPALTAMLARATALYRRHGSKLPPVLTLLLVALLAWQLAALLWSFVPLPKSAAWTPAPGFVDPTPARPPVNFDALASAHVFGELQTTVATASLANAPDTQLAFTLLGILAGSTEKESLALIAKDNTDEAPYAIGDDVSQGVTLQAIFPDRVILARQGRLETLRLDKDAPSNAPLVTQAATPTIGDVQEGTPAAAQMLANIKEQVLTDPSKAANFIRVQPISGESGVKGYRVYPGPERGAFNAAGLKPGDVVTSINGTPLNDPGQALQVLQSLSQSSSMSLTVDRNGVSQRRQHFCRSMSVVPLSRCRPFSSAMKFRLALALLLSCLLSVAQADVTLNLKEAEINTLISTVSEVTGKNFIVDPRVKGKVTVISAAPMDKQAVYETFLAVLQVLGFAAVPAGDAIKIIPDTNARSDGGILTRSGAGMPLDDLVTYVYAVKNISAAQLVPILRPIMAQSAHLAAYPGNNMLLIVDRAGNVARLIEIIKKLDGDGDRDVESVPLENAAASEVVRIITTFIQQAKAADPTAAAASVIADERSNAVLVGGDKGERARVIALIKRLDGPLKESDGNTQVVYLRYASAENLAPILEGYAAQVGAAAAPGGAAAAPAAAPAGGAGGFEKTRVLPDKDNNALVITAPPKTMRQIKSVIEQLDIQRAQVLVQAIIAEVSIAKTKQLGLDFAAFNPDGGAIASILDPTTLGAISGVITNGNPLAGLAAVAQGVTIGGGVIRNGGNSGTSFGLILKALQNDTDSNVLSTPTLTSLDNEESEVSVGQEVPFLSGSFSNTGGNNNGSVNPFQTIERKDVGLKLGVTPQINVGGVVKLKIKLESSSVAAGTVGTSSLVTAKRTITNTVNVASGQVLVIGGLTSENSSEAKAQIPFLGSVPIIGELFKSRNVTRMKTNLMVFIHPTVLRTKDEGDFYTRRKYDAIRIEQLQKAQNGNLPLASGPRFVLPDLDAYTRDYTMPKRASAPSVTAPAGSANSSQSPDLLPVPTRQPPSAGAATVPPAQPYSGSNGTNVPYRAAPEPSPEPTAMPQGLSSTAPSVAPELAPANVPADAAPAPSQTSSARKLPSNVFVIPAQRPGQSGTNR